MKKAVLAILLFLAAGFIDLRPIDLSSMQRETISVYVKGAVKNPGKIQLERYACEQDAINAAVPLANADLSGVNPLTVLKDKDCISIPEKKEEDAVKISINAGSLEDLCKLTGIGEGTAEKIIAYRNEHGLFQSIEELKKVSGIGEAKYAKIQDQICL